MKVFVALLLLACGCAYGPVDDVKLDASPNPTKDAAAPWREPRRSCRQVLSKQEIKSCTLYTFMCDDGETEMALDCHDHPMGEVTNPPRPINP